jgi:SAM-dependent methyltransferase
VKYMKEIIEKIQYFVVKNIYGDHNDAKNVRLGLESLLQKMPLAFLGLNIGAGQTNIHPNIKNLELDDGDNIDYVGSVLNIPCEDEKFDLVIAQEVLEHVNDPFKAIEEISRVLKKDGYFYLQLPFIIGYHPCPNDYWRFTHEGIRELLDKSKFNVVELKISVGPAVGFYRILVEFLSLILSLGIPLLYKPMKLISAILCWPIKLLDPFLIKTKEANRISGGYYIIGQKD